MAHLHLNTDQAHLDDPGQQLYQVNKFQMEYAMKEKTQDLGLASSHRPRIVRTSYPLTGKVCSRSTITCDISSSEEELRLVVGEEGRVPAALIFGQCIQLALKPFVRLDCAWLTHHLHPCNYVGAETSGPLERRALTGKGCKCC